MGSIDPNRLPETLDISVCLEKVSYRFAGNGSFSLHDIDFSLEKGSFTLLVGPSGSGKSTLLKILRGLHHELGGNFSGRILVDGCDITNQSAALLSTKVAIVFQNPSYQLHLPRVVDEVVSAPMYQGLPWDECINRAAQAIDSILDGFPLLANTAELSLGQQQKVALAASISMQSEILLFDEPFSYLDGKATNEMVRLLTQLHNKGKTIVVATHDLGPVVSLANQALLMENGRLTGPVPLEMLMLNDTLFETLGRHPILAISRHVHRRRGGPPRMLDWDEIASMTSAQAALSTTQPIVPEDDHKINSKLPAVEFLGVSYLYPNGNVGVTDLNLRIDQGEILGIVGHNGSGKSTLAKLILRTIRPTRGVIRINGQDIKRTKQIAKVVGYVTQNPSDMLFETNVLAECSFGPTNLDFPNPTEVALQALRELGIDEHVDRDPRSLSGGQQRLLSLADVLATKPGILILDEPEFGLDHHAFDLVCTIVQRLKAASKTIIFISHNLESAFFNSDRIAIMQGGQIHYVGQAANLMKRRQVIEDAGLVFPPFFEYTNLLRKSTRTKPTVSDFIDAIVESMVSAKC